MANLLESVGEGAFCPFSRMSVNPFMSLERQNFPEFSPMFKKKTPTSTEVGVCLKLGLLIQLFVCSVKPE